MTDQTPPDPASSDPAKSGVPPLTGRTLPCGRNNTELADVATDPEQRPDEHQLSCRFCRAELAELASAWSSVQSVAEQSVAVPAERINRIVEGVHNRIHQPGEYRVMNAHTAAQPGALRISESVLLDVARRAAESVHGVAAVTGTLGDKRIDLDVVMPYGTDLGALAQQVRTRTAEAVHVLSGAAFGEIGVRIVDVTGP